MVKLNKNQIKPVVRDWLETEPLQHYKREQKKLIDRLENHINRLVELNNQILEIEEKAFNHVRESENESESESENDSDSKSNVDVDNPKTIPRHFGPKNFDLSKIKKGDMLGPKWKNDSKNDQDEGLKRIMK